MPTLPGLALLKDQNKTRKQFFFVKLNTNFTIVHLIKYCFLLYLHR